jgi:hypothetical protein
MPTTVRRVTREPRDDRISYAHINVVSFQIEE